MALILLVEPLALPVPPVRAIESDGIIARTLNWTANECMKLLRAIVLGAPFLLIYWVLDVDSWLGLSVDRLRIWLGTPESVPGALELNFGFYLLLFVMIYFRAIGAAVALGDKKWILALYGLVSSVVLISILTLTGGIVATSDSWQAPVTGTIATFCFGLGWHLFWGGVDGRGKRNR